MGRRPYGGGLYLVTAALTALAAATTVMAASAVGHQASGGGWQGVGRMLALSQRGYAKSSPPMRPFARLPDGARVSSINWRIETDRPLPARSALAICLPGKCVRLDGLAGFSDALAGMTADNPLTLLIKVEGRGAITPPVIIRYYQVQVNYRRDAAR